MPEYELYLCHHGVKGMKWGVRKKKDRYVSRIQSRRNAAKAAKESKADDIKKGVSSISTVQKHAALAKAKSRLADAEYNQQVRENRQASRKANREVLKEKIKSTANKGLEKVTGEKARNAAIKAAAKGAKAASKLALYSAIDDVFYGGVGKKIAKETLVQTGRAATTAVLMAMGRYDIKWYDKYGRRVG